MVNTVGTIDTKTWIIIACIAAIFIVIGAAVIAVYYEKQKCLKSKYKEIKGIIDRQKALSAKA